MKSEKEEADKKIEEKEVNDALDKVNSDKNSRD